MNARMRNAKRLGRMLTLGKHFLKDAEYAAMLGSSSEERKR
jgi:hypothetical protein